LIRKPDEVTDQEEEEEEGEEEEDLFKLTQ